MIKVILVVLSNLSKYFASPPSDQPDNPIETKSRIMVINALIKRTVIGRMILKKFLGFASSINQISPFFIYPLPLQ